MNILQCGLALSVCVLTTADKNGPAVGFPAVNDAHSPHRYFNPGNRYFEGHQNILPFAFGNNGGHQGFGGFQSPLFTPVLVQPIKTGVTFDNGWKGIETGHGSIKQGLAIANAAFGQRAVIPVYENVNDIPPTKPVHSDFGLQNFGYVGNIGHQKAFALPLNNFVNNFAPLHQNLNYNVKDMPKNIKNHKNLGSQKYRNHYESGPKFTPNPHLGNHQESGLKHAPNPHHVPNIHHNEEQNHDYGHSHDKATSYQSFVIHSYKPVPVYAKYDHKHVYDGDANDDDTRSRGRQNHSH